MDLGRKMRAEAAKGVISAKKSANTMLYFEEPEHSLRQRRLVAAAFTRNTVLDVEPFTKNRIEKLLDALGDRREFDLFNDVADHIPVSVICQLLGVPPSDVPVFRDWTRLMAPATGVSMTETVKAKAEEAVIGLMDYFNRLIPQHRANNNDDLLSKMIRAHDGGDHLSEEELVALSIFLLSAGSDTTTQAMCAVTRQLAKNPDQYRLLRADRGLVRNAIEEAMRHSGPVHYAQPRYVRVPLKLPGDIVVDVGETVLPHVGGAHRDPRHFTSPDMYDLGREDTRHLGFSQGMHTCMGSSLARLELSIFLNAFLDRFEEIELIEEPAFVDLGPMRGVDALKLRVKRAN